MIAIRAGCAKIRAYAASSFCVSVKRSALVTPIILTFGGLHVSHSRAGDSMHRNIAILQSFTQSAHDSRSFFESLGVVFKNNGALPLLISRPGLTVLLPRMTIQLFLENQNYCEIRIQPS